MEKSLAIDELRQLERLCLEQAQQCSMPEAKAALLALAGNYAAAALKAMSRSVLGRRRES